MKLHRLFTKSLLAIFVLTFLVSQSAFAATRYVSPNGNDTTGDGTQARPWKTFAWAFKATAPANPNRVVAGDTLYLEPGATFTESLYPASGTSANPVTVTSDPANPAIIRSATWAGIGMYDTKYVRISNIKVAGLGRTITPAWLTAGIIISTRTANGCEDIVLTNVSVSDSLNGVKLESPGLSPGSIRNITFNRCEFFNNSNTGLWAKKDINFLSGNYTQTGTTVTVTATAHGLSVGDSIAVDITSGTGVDGTYTVASVSGNNTFTYTAGTSLTTSGSVSLSNFSNFLTNLTVNDSSFYNNFNNNTGAGAGVYFDYGVVSSTFNYCKAYGNGSNFGSKGQGGFYIFGGGSLTFKNCEAYNNSGNIFNAAYKDGAGFALDSTYSTTIENCYTRDNLGAGYAIIGAGSSTDTTGNPQSGNVVRYSISYNDAKGRQQGAIHLFSPSPNRYLSDSHFYNNTVLSIDASPVWLNFGTLAGITMRNNIFVTAPSNPLIRFTSSNPAPNNIAITPSVGQCLFQGNNYWTGGAVNLAGFSSLDAWRSAQSQELLNGVPVGSVVNPMFNDTRPLAAVYTSNSIRDVSGITAFKLHSSSPLINNGLSLPFFGYTITNLTDFYGSSLPQSGSFDVGAFERPAVVTVPPSAPVGPLAITQSGANLPVVLTWTDAATDETGFRVERSSDNVNFATVATLGSNVATYSDISTSPNVVYYYRVHAFNSAGKSASLSGTFTTAASQADFLKAVSNSRGSVTLTWTQQSGVTSYTIRRATSPNGPYTTVATGVKGLQFTNKMLKSGVKLYYTVSGIRPPGEVVSSNAAVVTTR